MEKMAVRSYLDSTTTTKTDSAGRKDTYAEDDAARRAAEEAARAAEAEAARRAKIQAQIDANNLEIARLNKKIQEYKTMQGQISVAQDCLAQASGKPTYADATLQSNYDGSELANLQSVLRKLCIRNIKFNKFTFRSL